jgi:rhodanese-related sulfurtransferase
VRRVAPFIAVVAVAAAACGGGTDTAVGVVTVDAARADGVIADASDGLVVLDIRTPEEFAAGRLADSVNIDFYAADFAARIDALDRDAPYVMYCRTGNRSETAAAMMRDMGFSEVYEIDGGIVSWVESGFTIVP